MANDLSVDIEKLRKELSMEYAMATGQIPPLTGQLSHKPLNPNPVTIAPGLTFTPRKDDKTWQEGGLSAEEMLVIRLRLRPGERMALRHISAFCDEKVADEKVAVVMVVLPNGKPVMIEDDVNLYPSDTLITQLRMLMETGS